MDFTGASDEELIERLDINKIAIKLEGDDDWQLIKEICKRHELAGYQLLVNTPAEEQDNIRDIQFSIKKWRKILGELEMIKKMGKIAFEAAKERELIAKR